MLPASDLAEILTNLSALNLQPNITAAVLGAVLTPLIRSADPQQPAQQRQRAERPRVAARRTKSATVSDLPADSPRQRAARALKANPGVSLTKVAAIKAHVDPTSLEQARADLGIVTSRGNTGNTLSVQWSLPG
jgi:hypothetical protein